MCGICGVFSETRDIESLKRGVVLMNQAQICRGPDDEGVFSDSPNGIVLGHRRLSIIDLSPAGRGPMGYKSSGLQITFNGEIYNFLELKKGLSAKGYKFKTKTDTEVVLALYQECGPESFSKLRGMFAFALWDSEKQKLFLVKDRYGIKPLYYYSNKENLIFGSSVKALEKSGLVPKESSLDALIGFLLLGSVPSPFTTLKNVFSLPSGYYLERDFKGNQKLTKYYEPLSFFRNKHETDFNSAASEIKNRLSEAVKLHLISDAPLGIFLSGGLDSSAIAAFAALNRREKITTLSVTFEEAEFSEKKYQDLMREKLNSDHKEIKITKNQFLDSYDEIFEAMDQPTIDGVNTFFISKAAKEAGLKVVLSGLGSDEIFCGYSNFHRAELLRKIQKFPRIFKLPLKIISLKKGRYSRLNYLFSKDILSFYLGLRGLFSPKETAKILGVELNKVNEFIENYSSTALPQEILKDLGSLNPIDLLSYLELKFYLQNQLLKDTDFMSMHHSIEVRVPFLDHLVVEYLSSLPPDLKLGKKINKSLLIKTVEDLIPEEILYRKKMGFTFPFEKWLGSKDSHWSRSWANVVLNRWR